MQNLNSLVHCTFWLVQGIVGGEALVVERAGIVLVIVIKAVCLTALWCTVSLAVFILLSVFGFGKWVRPLVGANGLP